MPRVISCRNRWTKYSPEINKKLVYNDKYYSSVAYVQRRGGVLSPKSYVDVPAGPQKSDYLYTNFWPNFPPISIPFLKEKHPILIKLGAFYNNLPKIHPIYVIWAPSSLMKTPRSLYQISRKSAPKGRHIYTYTMSMWEPPPPRGATLKTLHLYITV